MTHLATLDIQHLIKGHDFDGRQRLALDDIHLTIPPGQFVGVVGIAGCGKSTLLRLLAGLEGKFFGHLRLGDDAIVGPSLERSIVFPEPRLMPWLSVSGNIELGLLNAPISRAEKRARVARYLELLRLEDVAQTLPRELGAGMAQRVAIARALVNRPKVLLLDEPFGALDALTRAQLQDQLLEIWQRERLTIVFATHDVEEAVYLGDRVVVMTARPGRVVHILDIPLQRPRDRGHPGFAQLRSAVLESLAGRPPEHPPAGGLRLVARNESLPWAAVNGQAAQALP
jgi:ABC-type nitrate/sulfonate/bicarbonate transport system ATPase subunit